jgi:hypothetical protein
VTRPEASLELLSLGATTPGLAGARLVEAGHAFATGSPEVRANVIERIGRVALLLRIECGPGADAYGQAAQIVADVG